MENEEKERKKELEKNRKFAEQLEKNEIMK